LIYINHFIIDSFCNLLNRKFSFILSFFCYIYMLLRFNFVLKNFIWNLLIKALISLYFLVFLIYSWLLFFLNHFKFQIFRQEWCWINIWSIFILIFSDILIIRFILNNLGLTWCNILFFWITSACTAILKCNILCF
jgi:hypothetical protein